MVCEEAGQNHSMLVLSCPVLLFKEMLVTMVFLISSGIPAHSDPNGVQLNSASSHLVQLIPKM